MKLIHQVFFSILVALSLAGSANADERQTASGEWEYAASVYGFLPGISGDVSAFGIPTTINVDLTPLEFGEKAIDNFDFAFMGAFEATREDHGVFFDLLYMKLSGGDSTPRRLFTSANLDLSLSVATAMGSYRAIETDKGHLDLMAGARMWSVDLDFELTAGLAAPFVRSDGDTWVDPMAGFKGKYELGGPWSLTGWAMIGAGSSDISWGVLGAVNYEVRDDFSLIVGWRAAGVDYQSGGFLFDVVFSGPVVAGVWRF